MADSIPIPDMANVQEQATRWYTWFTELSIVPPEYRYFLRMISWFFVTLALLPIVPICLLVIYDFGLWMWRLAGAGSDPKRPMAQKLENGAVTSPTDSLKHGNSRGGGTSKRTRKA